MAGGAKRSLGFAAGIVKVIFMLMFFLGPFLRKPSLAQFFSDCSFQSVHVVSVCPVTDAATHDDFFQRIIHTLFEIHFVFEFHDGDSVRDLNQLVNN